MRAIELFEDRVGWLRNQYADKVNSKPLSYNDQTELQQFDSNPFDYLIGVDPSKNKQYFQWIIRLFLTDKFKLEDSQKLTQYLEWFDSNKQKLEPRLRDINSYKDIPQLFSVMKQMEEDDFNNSVSELQNEINRGEELGIIDTWYTDSRVGYYVPKTYEGSLILGKGTEWCTAYTNTSKWFDQYSKEGPLIVMWNKYDNQRFQLHPPSDQLMNQDDESVDCDTIMDEFPRLLYMECVRVGFRATPERKVWFNLASMAWKLSPISPQKLIHMIGDDSVVLNAIEEDPELLSSVDTTKMDIDFLSRLFFNAPRNSNLSLDDLDTTKQRETIEMELLDTNLDYAKRYDIETEAAQEKLISLDPYNIEWLKYPKFNIQCMAIDQDPEIINNRWVRSRFDDAAIEYAERLLRENDDEDE